MTQRKISISEKIVKFRAENKLSQSEFGRRLGVSPQAVYKWEKEICYPDITILPSLAELVGCMVDDFFK